MSRSSTGINYSDTYFQYKELTNIHGEPTYDSIKRLHNQVKANAASVPSTLGGGTFGHLGLVLTPQQYAMISNAPFNRPNHPGPCVIPQNSTQAQIQAIKDTHTEQLRIFNEVLGVEAALRQQINAAVEDLYLKAIRNRQTNAIILPVSDIFHEHLYPTYGEVDTYKLEEAREKVVQTTYDVSYPPDVIYETIEDLMDMGAAASDPFTQRQAVTMAMNIINRTGKFETDMRSWFERPQAQQTWINFKQHFTRAHKAMKKLNQMRVGNTMEFQQANVIQQMVLAAVEDLAESQPPPTAPTPEPELAEEVNHTVNATLMDTNQQLMQQMTEMMRLMQQMQTAQCNTTAVPTPTIPRGRGARNRPWKYCHTHGFCTHDGRECNNKGTNHNDAATLTDNMGGSQKNVEKYRSAMENQNT